MKLEGEIIDTYPGSIPILGIECEVEFTKFDSCTVSWKEEDQLFQVLLEQPKKDCLNGYIVEGPAGVIGHEAQLCDCASPLIFEFKLPFRKKQFLVLQSKRPIRTDDIRVIEMPRNFYLTIKQAACVLDFYWQECPAVWDLYQKTGLESKDVITENDLLALNAINAFMRNPMQPMTSFWVRHKLLEKDLKSISHTRLEDMSENERLDAIVKLSSLAKFLEGRTFKGVGETSASKFLHRMRPLFAPICDSKVNRWFSLKGVGDSTWLDYYTDVCGRVFKNRNALKEAVAQSCHPDISIVRAWDIILWTLATI